MTVQQQIRAMIKDFHRNKVNLYRHKTHVIVYDSGSNDDIPVLTYKEKVEEIVDFLGGHNDVSHFYVYKLGPTEYSKQG